MNKQLTKERAVIWSQNMHKGKTCTIDRVVGDVFQVHFDGDDKTIRSYLLTELYFPNHPLGYNQKCFQ